MISRTKYPVDSYVYYRDNHGDMIIARVVTYQHDYRVVKPLWYAAEPVVHLPLRKIKSDGKLLRIPTSIIEKE